MLAVRNIILNVTLMGCQTIIFLRLYHPRVPEKKTWRMYVCFMIGIMLLYSVCVLLMGVETTARIIFFICAAPAILFYVITSHHWDGKFWVSYCIAGMAVGVANIIGLILTLSVFGSRDIFHILIRCGLMIGVTVPLCTRLCGKYQSALLLMRQGWNLFAVFMVIQYVMLMVYVSYPTSITERPDDFDSALMLCAVVILSAAGFLAAIISMGRINEENLNQKEQKNELEIARLRIRNGERQYHVMMESIEKFRMIRHDLNHHFRVIRSFSENGEYKALDRYLDDIDIRGMTEQIPYYSKNHVVNVIIGYYVMEAEESKIAFSQECNIPGGIPDNETHLGVLLGNGLENAMEAAGKVETDPFVDIKIKYLNKKIVIVIKNSYCGGAQETEQGLESTKAEPGHGVGMRSMKRIAAMYHGYCEYKIGTDTFLLSIVLHIN